MHADICTTTDRLFYLAMTERYVAVIIYDEYSEKGLIKLYQQWKSEGCTSPFIIVTKCQSGLQRARLLELGVTFYYIQPFSYTQLVSSVLLKEYKDHTVTKDFYQSNHFKIDILRRTVHCGKLPIYFTRMEFDIFSFLVRYRGIVLSRMQIWEEVWGYEKIPETNTVDVHIGRLRKKLPEHLQKLISTVHGIGYQISERA